MGESTNQSDNQAGKFLTAFVDFLIEQQVLLFGDFVLKSGIKSPYFFNAGQFKTGRSLGLLGEFYADKIIQEKIEFDLLFGPAYKGIPLVSSVAIALFKKYGVDKPFCFNRKEIKDHGEGGAIVGESLKGRVLIIDDVVTRGTAFRESQKIIEQAGAKVAGLVITLDRQEPGLSGKTAIEALESQGILVHKILTVRDLLKILENQKKFEWAELIKKHLGTVGARFIAP